MAPPFDPDDPPAAPGPLAVAPPIHAVMVTYSGRDRLSAVVKACWSDKAGDAVRFEGTGRINPKLLAVPQNVGWNT